MASEEILSQDEIDALLHGVESGDVETDDVYRLHDGVPRAVDLAAHEKIVRGRMPTLEMINNRFCRNFRVSLFGLLQRAAEVSFQGIRVTKFSEYMHTLAVPTSLNMVKLSPLSGTGLAVFDARLVFALVENFFGGDGRLYTRVEGREFSAMENRVIQMALQRAFTDMRDAWAPVLDLSFDYVSSEVNPQFANIVSPTEIVVVSTFLLDLDGMGGEIHLTLPYSMIEPIRDLLDAGVQSDRDLRDDRWGTAIRREMEAAEVELHADLLQARISLSDLLAIKAGDILPVELPDEVVLCAEGVELFSGQVGVANGNNAIRIHKRMGPERTGGSARPVARKRAGQTTGNDNFAPQSVGAQVE
ncbi:MAG: flagellar motor switch protein FliM [Gammaproteobacteria bacterium]|nr:MAG: flagellar motor switch protein FliM [Gammaproteobacteria bacterium]